MKLPRFSSTKTKSYLRIKSARLGFPLTRQDRFFHSLRKKHLGKTCVIIGMGPSLRPSDLELFSDYATFGCNKIYLAFENTKWRPTYYTIIDHVVAENLGDSIRNIGLEKSTMLFPQNMAPLFPGVEGIRFYNRKSDLQDPDGVQVALSRERLGEAILDGSYTVVGDQIQLAMMLGFQKIYLVGLDCSFTLGKKTGETSESGEVLEAAGEKNHFHKDYRKPGERWTVPRMEEQFIAFEKLNQIAKARGIELINASRQTRLECIKRADFEEVFLNSSSGD